MCGGTGLKQAHIRGETAELAINTDADHIMLDRPTLKGGPQLADRAETADHIHKDATDRYAPYLNIR